MHRTIRTDTLEIAYEQSGPEDGTPVILLHGFPDDVRTWDGVAPPLAAAGFRVIVPWLRGYGPTRFLDRLTPRSGQQAALGADLLEMMDALGIETALLAGYDWGGRAACIVSALWPERVIGLVTHQRLQHPEHPGLRRAGRRRAGTAALVPVVFPHGTRPQRPDRQPRRHLPAAVAALVAELAVR